MSTRRTLLHKHASDVTIVGTSVRYRVEHDRLVQAISELVVWANSTPLLFGSVTNLATSMTTRRSQIESSEGWNRAATSGNVDLLRRLSGCEIQTDTSRNFDCANQIGSLRETRTSRSRSSSTSTSWFVRRKRVRWGSWIWTGRRYSWTSRPTSTPRFVRRSEFDLSLCLDSIHINCTESITFDNEVIVCKSTQLSLSTTHECWWHWVVVNEHLSPLFLPAVRFFFALQTTNTTILPIKSWHTPCSSGCCSIATSLVAPARQHAPEASKNMIFRDDQASNTRRSGSTVRILSRKSSSDTQVVRNASTRTFSLSDETNRQKTLLFWDLHIARALELL